MPTSGVKNYKWANATQGIQGQLVKLTVAETVDVSTSIADTPFGPLANAPKQNETAQPTYMMLGDMVQVLADGTTDILIGDPLKVNATGRAVKAARSGTFVATVTWIIGFAMEGFTTNGDGIITVRWIPQEGSWA
jgi:hypothetical protein